MLMTLYLRPLCTSLMKLTQKDPSNPHVDPDVEKLKKHYLSYHAVIGFASLLQTAYCGWTISLFFFPNCVIFASGLVALSILLTVINKMFGTLSKIYEHLLLVDSALSIVLLVLIGKTNPW